MNEIQKGYIAAKKKYDNAIVKVERHVRLALKKDGINYSSAPEELLDSLRAEGNREYIVAIRRSELWSKESQLIRWGYERLMKDEMVVEREQPINSSDTKLKTIRDSIIENFSKMED